MENKQTSSAQTKEFIMTLPFRSEQVDYPEANFDVSVWRSATNICECRDNSACDTSGLYYGSAEDEVTTFCPRHFYELHRKRGGAYRLIDPVGPHTSHVLADPDFVAVQPWTAKVVGEESDPDATVFDQALWRCDQNICECAGSGWCDGTGYFYGTEDMGEPKTCARHHFLDPGYTLIDLAQPQVPRWTPERWAAAREAAPLPDERWAAGMRERFGRYPSLHLEEKIRLAMDILWDVNDTWDHDRLAHYPEGMPSFDAFLDEIGDKLHDIRWTRDAKPS